jgi:hypothetical protein
LIEKRSVVEVKSVRGVEERRKPRSWDTGKEKGGCKRKRSKIHGEIGKTRGAYEKDFGAWEP